VRSDALEGAWWLLWLRTASLRGADFSPQGREMVLARLACSDAFDVRTVLRDKSRAPAVEGTARRQGLRNPGYGRFQGITVGAGGSVVRNLAWAAPRCMHWLM
jgi:hypothetical protein